MKHVYKGQMFLLSIELEKHMRKTIISVIILLIFAVAGGLVEGSSIIGFLFRASIVETGDFDEKSGTLRVTLTFLEVIDNFSGHGSDYFINEMKKKDQSITLREVRKEQASKITPGSTVDVVYKNSSGMILSHGERKTFSNISLTLQKVL